MIAQIFAVVELILKAFQIWDAFLSYMDAKHSADLEIKRQAREAAIDKSKVDENDDDLFKDQDSIVRNMP
jgi:hypothetical protein